MGTTNVRIGRPAPHCRTVLQNGRRTKPGKHFPRICLSWNTCQDFNKIPSLWEAALETERRCFSKVFLESNVTPNIARSSDSLFQYSSANSFVCDLEIIIVLVSFHFIPQRSHHSLTPQISRIASKFNHKHNWSAYFPEWNKALKCTGGTITCSK